MIGRWVLGVCLVLASAAQSAYPQELPDNPLQGRLLFERSRCNQCHAIAGTGHGVGPDLGGGRFKGTFLDLGAALWNHVPGMSGAFEGRDLSWPDLSADETARLMAFLYFIDYLGRPGVAASGERIFRSHGCATCHTLGGDRAGVGPDLTGLRRFVSPLYLAQAVWNHGPSMFETMRQMGMSAPTFSEGDLADLSAFIRQKNREGLTERLLLAPGNPNRGRDLFQVKACTICHGVDGHGGNGGPDLSRSGLPRSAEGIAGAMWNHAPVMREAMRAQGVGWPSFSTADLADLVAYLYFLPFADPSGDPRRGAEVFENRSCIACHSGTSDVTHPGPALLAEGTVTSAPNLVAAMWNHAPIMREAILGEGRPWPELTGEDLRDLLALLSEQRSGADAPGP
jgi:mono/diheme cytochrome c family protein